MIKAVFFDFDDTLVSKKDHTMRENTEKAIKLLKKSGIIPIIATGRPKYTINEYLDKLSINNAVFLNGHTVWLENKIIHDQIMMKTKPELCLNWQRKMIFHMES